MYFCFSLCRSYFFFHWHFHRQTQQLFSLVSHFSVHSCRPYVVLVHFLFEPCPFLYLTTHQLFFSQILFILSFEFNSILFVPFFDGNVKGLGRSRRLRMAGGDTSSSCHSSALGQSPLNLFECSAIPLPFIPFTITVFLLLIESCSQSSLSVCMPATRTMQHCNFWRVYLY